MLNLNGSLTKARVKYSTLWSLNFTDSFFKRGLREWLATGRVTHATSHVRDLTNFRLPQKDRDLGEGLAADLRNKKAIMGVFDEGCMGMFNAIIPDHLLNPPGVFKERPRQSALFAQMRTVSAQDATAVRSGVAGRSMRRDGKFKECDHRRIRSYAERINRQARRRQKIVTLEAELEQLIFQPPMECHYG